MLGKFPESKYSSIGGFFFLRFICPAIVSPEQYGLLDGTVRPFRSSSSLSRRPSVTVCAARQRCGPGQCQSPCASARFEGAADHGEWSRVWEERYVAPCARYPLVHHPALTLPTTKPHNVVTEPYMIPMNSFIQANTSRVHEFFDQLAVPQLWVPATSGS